MVPQLCVTRPKRKAPIVALGCFMIEQQGQSLSMAQVCGVTITIQFGKGMGHPGQPQLVQLIKGWVFEHRRSFQW